MKNFIYFLSILIIGLGFNSCKCTHEIIVEETVKADREVMAARSNNDYIWFETEVVFKDYLDEENDGKIEKVINTFEIVTQIDSTSADVWVYKFTHTNSGVNEQKIHDFVLEDRPLNDRPIKLSFKEAYEKVKECNYPKPHSHFAVLREAVDPTVDNPEWIFGNFERNITVDTVTGEITYYSDEE